MTVYSTNLSAPSAETESESAAQIFADGSSVLTGSYHNYFRIYDVNSDNDVVLQADKSAFKAKKVSGGRNKAPGKKEGLQTEGIDFTKKIVSDALDRADISYMQAGIRGRTP